MMSAETNKVDVMQEADRYFRALRAKQNEVAILNAYYDAELERISNWYKEDLKTLTDATDSIENALKTMYEGLLEENPKAKLNTPYGKVTKRTMTKWNWNDKKLLQGLKDKGLTEFVEVEVSEKPMKNELKKALIIADNGKVIDPNGEEFDLVEVREETTYSVKVVEVDD